jgi:hypothetical protein
MFELESAPPTPEGSVRRGVFLGMLLDLFQIALFPSILIICEIVYPPYEKPDLVAFMLYFWAWSLTRFLYLGPAAWLAYRRGQPKTGKGFLLVGGFGVLLNAIWLAFVFLPSFLIYLIRKS